MASDRKTIVRDVCLIVAIALVGLVLLFALSPKAEPGSFVVVEVDGKSVARYPLSQDGVYVLNGGSNTLEISGGRVRMLDADCTNRQCIRQMWISRSNQSIVCLPNRVVVTIAGGDSSVDFVL